MFGKFVFLNNSVKLFNSCFELYSKRIVYQSITD